MVFFVIGLVCLARFEKLIIYNPTPSVEEGFYVYAGQEYGRGQIILFSTPQAVKDYTAANYAAAPLEHFLKPVLAAKGDHVCYRQGQFFLNGAFLSDVQKYDSAGKPLPVWKGCRVLGADEYFVFSDRVRNSFDSRYYGPVPEKDIVGVFAPLFEKG